MPDKGSKTLLTLEEIATFKKIERDIDTHTIFL